MRLLETLRCLTRVSYDHLYEGRASEGRLTYKLQYDVPEILYTNDALETLCGALASTNRGSRILKSTS
jgi:hypothetical protein